MANNKLAIIGGSGLYDVEEFKDREILDLDTPWGKPSDKILKAKYNSKEIYFLPRHGKGHFISPSNINFRANIDALKQIGVTDIVSVSAVGSLKEELPPGKFVIVDQFIDRTFARNKTFFDDEIVAHVSMAHPTSNGLMNACEEAIKKENIDFQRGGTYVVMEGPQFSTFAESNYGHNDLTLIDGVRVRTKDGWWLVRASNTEEALVVRAEGNSIKALDRLVKNIEAALRAAGLKWQAKR